MMRLPLNSPSRHTTQLKAEENKNGVSKKVFCRVDFIVYTRYFFINYKKVDFYFFLMYYIYINQD